MTPGTVVGSIMSVTYGVTQLSSRSEDVRLWVVRINCIFLCISKFALEGGSSKIVNWSDADKGYEIMALVFLFLYSYKKFWELYRY